MAKTKQRQNTTEYSTQKDYAGWVEAASKKRKRLIEDNLRKAFAKFIEYRKVEVIIFSDMSVNELAKALSQHPIILKPLLAACNLGARAIERDLQIKNLNTYEPKLTEQQTHAISGYLKVFLPQYIELPSLAHIDRIEFIDKEIRMRKGGWERLVLESLNMHGKQKFKKRTFEVGGETFEIDAAAPVIGSIKIAVDVKRIEARRDVHKRCDEIVSKAAKLRRAIPKARFAAVIYYPFIAEHSNIQNRLQSPNIAGVVFAGESKETVDNATRMLLAKLGFSK